MGVVAVIKKLQGSDDNRSGRRKPETPETDDDAPLPYRRKQYLLSKAEKSFYEVLRGAVGKDVTIFAMIRLIDLVYLPKGTKNRRAHVNRIKSKHVDFTLCSRGQLKPLLVIELDDASHQSKKRQERDAFLDKVLAAAGLPILHVPAKQGYPQAELAARIQQSIQGIRQKI